MDYYSLCNDFLCVKNMDDRHRESLKQLVNIYAEKMYTKTMISGRPTVVYDFEHHCLNLYKIISNIIFDEAIVYADEVGLNQTELYILNLSILLHAISIFMGNVTRLCDYPGLSADLVEEWFQSGSSELSRVCVLKQVERYALVDVIRFHNDSTNDVSKACDLTELKRIEDSVEYMGGKIRSKLLAGVLRLANKMDFTAERLGNDDSEEQLRKMIDEKKYPPEFEDEYIRSRRDFDKLHYISHMERSENRQRIILVIDDRYVEKRLDDGAYLDDVRDFLITIYSELELQLSKIKSEIFDTYEAAHYVQVKEIEFKTNNSDLDDELKKKIKLMDPSKSKAQSVLENTDTTEASTDIGEAQRCEISLVSNDIAQRLNNEVSDRNLLKFGHFRLDSQYCARDWIDTRELVETEKILSEMVKHIIMHIDTQFQEKDVIVGVDLVGSLLASRIVFPLGCPMTYVIPDIEIPYSVKPDIDVDISQYNKIIMVVDSIVTGETLNRIIHNNKLEDKIVAIYTMFYRKCKAPMLLDKSLLSKTYCLNDTYGAEIFEMKNCPYKDKKCMAKNSRVY